MKWYLLALGIGLLFVGEASAQLTGPNNPSGYAPNYYNRNNQPLSPYLNLLRGSNTAVNYFYGARPGLPSGGYTGMFQNQQTRQTFFPVVDTLSDLLVEPQDAGKVSPSGHPVGFGNTMGYFGGASPMNRGNTQQPANRRGGFGR
jgi:hypothetical protein